MNSIFIGYDPRETEAFVICRRSLREHNPDLPIHALDLQELRAAGLYQRPTSHKGNQLWDYISDAPMSTQFAISRFLTPLLAREGFALFMDCDMLCRDSLDELFEQVKSDPLKAIWCVKHNHVPKHDVKMDGQMQTRYARKNWSSVMVFNCEHPSHRKLTLELINNAPGRDLHAFCWLDEAEIGELDPKFNYLVGVSDETIDPAIVHFTSGGPWFENYDNDAQRLRDIAWGREWIAARSDWMAEETSVPGRPSTYVRPRFEIDETGRVRRRGNGTCP